MAAETRHVDATIRAFRESDSAAVTTILKESPQAADWTEASLRESTGWRGIVSLVSERDREVTGFIIGRQVADEAEILNLAVSPAKRGQGDGGDLLRAAMGEFLARRVSHVFLEVRESNAVGIAFYAKHGFSERDCRLNYYRDPDESAIVMGRKLGV